MWIDKELESPLQLNSIICLIDCVNFFKNFEENEEILKKQIICADKVVMNKIDLLEKISDFEQIKNEIKEVINEVNPICKIYE